jgi:hypothetical protein
VRERVREREREREKERERERKREVEKSRTQSCRLRTSLKNCGATQPKSRKNITKKKEAIYIQPTKIEIETKRKKQFLYNVR